MALKKDDIVELVEKDNNGWWLVKKDGVEAWAPNNYLELVPPKPKAAAAPPPPPPPPPAGKRPTPAPPAAAAAPKAAFKSISADPSAKPVAVFPGMATGNGSTTPWKRTASSATADSSNGSSTLTSSRPGSVAAKPPPLAAKPKPAPPPPVANKPSLSAPPKVGAKPQVPTAPRPGGAAPKAKVGGAAKPAVASGQMDLAAAVRDCNDMYYVRSQLIITSIISLACQTRAAHR